MFVVNVVAIDRIVYTNILHSFQWNIHSAKYNNINLILQIHRSIHKYKSHPRTAVPNILQFEVTFL